MRNLNNILNICEKSIENREHHKIILDIIKKYSEERIECDDTLKETELDKIRRFRNLKYLLEQKNIEFSWKVRRIFKELDEEELKFIKNNSDKYEIKRNAKEVLKLKRTNK